MMLSLFRLEHLGQDHVFIYLIKIPLPAPTKGTYLIKVFTLDFFPLNSKDYLCWLAIEVGWMGGIGEYGIYCLVRILARPLSTLTAGQISSWRAIWLRDRAILPLSPHFYHSSSGCVCVCMCAWERESIITASLWLSQTRYNKICIVDPLFVTLVCHSNKPHLVAVKF